MTDVVLDASAAVEILFNTATGQALRANIPSNVTEWVPEVYFVEVASVIRRAELNGRITPERAASAVDVLLAAPTNRVQVKPLLSEAWTLRQNMTVPDALYVVLARHLDAPLVTADVRLARTAGLGVRVIVP